MKIKKYIKAGWRLLTDKDYRFLFQADRGKYDKMPDEEYLKRMFKASVGHDLNLENPQTFNEKLQWLKLHDRKPEYTMMVDKYLVKDYITKIIGEQYVIPTIAVYDSPDEIDFNALPNQFVLKCNHNSGLGMYICKDKNRLAKRDIKQIKKNLAKGLAQDYYLHCREWPYKDVKRKIIAEKYMEDSRSSDLLDYKFFCFNGEFKCTMVCTDRFNGKGLKVTFYDKKWEILPFRRHYPTSNELIKKPINYQLMIELVEKLSKELPFVRVDFYEISGKPYFGELTLMPGAGFEEFEPASADLELGKWLKLPNSSEDAL